MNDRLIIFDTTLRDGEQAPGIALSPDDKVVIAKQLALLKVDVIEAGFAASSPGDFSAVSRIAAEVKGPTIASLARTHPDDIDQAADALKAADQKWSQGQLDVSELATYLEGLLEAQLSE